MKKALLVTRVSGFVPQHEMNNVKILQEMGFEVHYATDLENVVYGKDNRRLEGSGIIPHQIDFCRSPFSRKVKIAQRQLEELMLRESFDLVHCHMPMSGVVARRAAWQVRKETGREVPVLYTAHGFHFCHGVPWRNWLYYPIERHYARYTDRLILINEEDYRRGCRFPIRGKVVKISGVGMDLKKMEPYRKQCWEVGGEDLRERYGLPADCGILVSVGELSPSKNHLVAIEAMAELRDLNLVYLICGTGRMEEVLRKKVGELHLEENVCFAGYVENIPELLQQCDCFFFPSGREGLPVAVMEAMAVGLPVIAADIRGVHDLIQHGKGGYLSRSFSHAEYAAKARRLFTEKDGGSAVPRAVRREEMGRWNRERIREFSLKVVEGQMRQIYSEVVK
ncbi:MAG: glycosyltransferase family 4 protein [Lachnospiraceae bacterium]|nr:glycosyltransferase family 4 protein [Lachnospiraceae bacterium]